MVLGKMKAFYKNILLITGIATALATLKNVLNMKVLSIPICDYE